MGTCATDRFFPRENERIMLVFQAAVFLAVDPDLDYLMGSFM